MATATVRTSQTILPCVGALLLAALLILSAPVQAQPQRLEAGGQVALFQFDLVQGPSTINQKLWLAGAFLQVNMAPSLSFRLGGLFGGGSLTLLQLDTEVLARYGLGQVDLYLGGGVGFIQISSAGGFFSFQIPLFGVIGLQTSHRDSGLNGFVDFRPVLPMNLGNSLLQIGTGQPPFQFTFGFLYRL
jgi:hypothetical protein